MSEFIQADSNTYVYSDKRNWLDKVTGMLFNWKYRDVRTTEGVLKDTTPCFKIEFVEWNSKAQILLPTPVILYMAKELLNVREKGPSSLKIDASGWHLKLDSRTTIIIPTRFARLFLRKFSAMLDTAIVVELTDKLTNMVKRMEGVDDTGEDKAVQEDQHTLH